MLNRLILMTAALVLAVSPCASASDVPMLLNYQGNLTAPDGTPKNGTFSMQFAVYDADTEGNQLPSGSPWNETQSVQVTDGVFNVLLGSATPLPTDLFEGGPTDSAGPLRFLEVSVVGETLSPRRRIVSTAYTLQRSARAGLAVIEADSSDTPWGQNQSGLVMRSYQIPGGTLTEGVLVLVNWFYGSGYNAGGASVNLYTGPNSDWAQNTQRETSSANGASTKSTTISTWVGPEEDWTNDVHVHLVVSSAHVVTSQQITNVMILGQ